MKKKTKLLALAAVMVFLVLPLAVFELTTSQNTSAQSASHSEPIRVACVGDSITAESGYPSDLQALLGANYTVGNFGSSGSTVSLNSWKPYMNQTEFQMALDFNPDIVIIMLGTNDDLMGLHQYNGSFEDDYGKLITSFQQTKKNPTVIIANSPPIFSNNIDLSPAYLVNNIIPMTQHLANTMNLPEIDVYDALGGQPDSFVDGVHPNSQGASVIANEVYNSMDSIYDLN